jgi:alpha/beta hydrolase family protein
MKVPRKLSPLGVSVASPDLCRRNFTRLGGVLALVVLGSAAHGRITELLIDRVESPTFEGLSFGHTGQYEKLVGRVRGTVDPADPSNSLLTDIALAPRNPAGLVEYESDFFLLKPIDMRRGNRNIFYNVVNRGNKDALGNLNGASLVAGVAAGNPTTAKDAGDGLLMRQGYTILWSAWQADVLPGDNRMTMRVPVALNPDGSEITGELRTEYTVNAPTTTQNLGGASASYETVSLDTSRATLTRRVRESDPRVLVPSDAWGFASCAQVPFPGVPSTTQICLRDGFDPDHIYELIYTAKNPLVLGLGFAATRDVVSFFRHSMHDDAGTRNPLAIERRRTGIRHALIEGVSQSTRYIRTFIHLGFNTDEEGRIVFEGAYPAFSPGRIPLNVRFGHPTGGGGQHDDHLFPGSEAPFTYSPVYDPNTDRTDGILVRCEEMGTCPKIVHAMSSHEFWQYRHSLDQTDPLGTRDLDLPENVRMYLMSSTQHATPLTPPPGRLPDRRNCRWPANPAPHLETVRALWVALDRWVNDDVRPPPSRIPRLREGTLVEPDPATFGFPNIPATTYVPNYPTEAVDFNGVHNGLTLLDYGPEFDAANESGNITLNPPAVVAGRDYAVLVPAVDSDGNDVAGVRSTTIQAPLGTYTGWNRRRPGFAADELCFVIGHYIPFARSQAERKLAGDPRPSLEERYTDHDGYVAAVRTAAERLVAERLLLPWDAHRLIQEAEESDILR